MTASRYCSVPASRALTIEAGSSSACHSHAPTAAPVRESRASTPFVTAFEGRRDMADAASAGCESVAARGSAAWSFSKAVSIEAVGWSPGAWSFVRVECTTHTNVPSGLLDKWVRLRPSVWKYKNCVLKKYYTHSIKNLVRKSKDIKVNLRTFYRYSNKNTNNKLVVSQFINKSNV